MGETIGGPLLSAGIALIAMLASFIPVLITAFTVWSLSRRKRLNARTSPLTQDLARPPGHSLRLRIDRIEDDANAEFAFLMTIPGCFATGYLASIDFMPTTSKYILAFMMIASLIASCVVSGRRLLRYRLVLESLKTGLQGELFTAEELNQLMLDGCRVFHDIVFEYGNIDHVVVSPSGVFVVDTKTRGKPSAVSGAKRARLEADFQQRRLLFPDGTERLDELTESVKTQRDWLTKTLTSATGMPVQISGALAYPGWYVQSFGKNDIDVINPKNSKWYFLQKPYQLTTEQIDRIAHQLDQMRRDIKPVKARESDWE